MYYLDIDVNNPTEEDWRAVYGLLATQKDYVQGYVMDEIYNKMEKGEAWIAAYYAGDCLSMMSESADGVELGFYYPKNINGKTQTNVFADAMCIPASANEDNFELAHLYINFMLKPEIAYANAEYIYYGCPYDYTDLKDYFVFDENGKVVVDENNVPLFDTELYKENLEYVEAYRENMGMYIFEYDKDGEILLDDEDNYIFDLDEYGNKQIDYEGDYFVIYHKDFENDLENPNKLKDMFDKYAYKDLTNSYMEGTDVSNLDMLNESWEQLKVASTSMVGIYISCLVIALVIVAYIVYVQIKKRKQRRLYWANIPTPKAKPKDEPNPDLSATAVIAIEKAKKRDKDSKK